MAHAAKRPRVDEVANAAGIIEGVSVDEALVCSQRRHDSLLSFCATNIRDFRIEIRKTLVSDIIWGTNDGSLDILSTTRAFPETLSQSSLRVGQTMSSLLRYSRACLENEANRCIYLERGRCAPSGAARAPDSCSSIARSQQRQ